MCLCFLAGTRYKVIHFTICHSSVEKLIFYGIEGGFQKKHCFREEITPQSAIYNIFIIIKQEPNCCLCFDFKNNVYIDIGVVSQKWWMMSVSYAFFCVFKFLLHFNTPGN